MHFEVRNRLICRFYLNLTESTAMPQLLIFIVATDLSKCRFHAVIQIRRRIFLPVVESSEHIDEGCAYRTHVFGMWPPARVKQLLYAMCRHFVPKAHFRLRHFKHFDGILLRII